jgi:hypothetical protein
VTGALESERDERPRPERPPAYLWIRRLVLLVLALACARIIIDLVGEIDWDAVWKGIEHLEAWQFASLILLVVLRQVLNAMPLVYFIDGLSVFKATASDQGATLMSMIAPPTADSVFRIMVLRSGASTSIEPQPAAPPTSWSSTWLGGSPPCWESSCCSARGSTAPTPWWRWAHSWSRSRSSPAGCW